MADIHIEDEPEQFAPADEWVADAVALPWAGDGQACGGEFVLLVIDEKSIGAGFLEGNLDAFVMMGCESPVLVG